MTDNSQRLKNVIQSIHETMTQCKQRLKNAAMLHNLQQPDGEPELKPIVHNKSRWSGKYCMLDHFVAIRDQLVQVSDTEGLELDMNPSRVFLEKVFKYKNQLIHIQYVTKYLQTNQLKLCDCRMALDMLKGNLENHQDSANLYCRR